jgi:hypothetical protein
LTLADEALLSLDSLALFDQFRVYEFGLGEEMTVM